MRAAETLGRGRDDDCVRRSEGSMMRGQLWGQQESGEGWSPELLGWAMVKMVFLTLGQNAINSGAAGSTSRFLAYALGLPATESVDASQHFQPSGVPMIIGTSDAGGLKTFKPTLTTTCGAKI